MGPRIFFVHYNKGYNYLLEMEELKENDEVLKFTPYINFEHIYYEAFENLSRYLKASKYQHLVLLLHNSKGSLSNR